MAMQTGSNLLVFEQDLNSELNAIIQNGVDTSNTVRVGGGSGTVYGYSYICCPDRMNIGQTDGDTVERIYAQISTSTPDKPLLLLEIKTERPRSLEKAIHAILQRRDRKVAGGGEEWFLTTRDEILAIWRFIDATNKVTE
jgi:hypothetical protein